LGEEFGGFGVVGGGVVDQVVGEPTQGEGGIEVPGDLAFFYFKVFEPFHDPVFGGVVEVDGFFMEGLEEGGVDDDFAAGLEDSADFAGGLDGVSEMLEDVEGDDGCKGVVLKGRWWASPTISVWR
jgi:hypothetical protein